MTRIVVFFVASFGVAAALVACASDGYRDYDRHTMSQMRMSDDGDFWLFDAKTDARYPTGSLNAEAMRMRWAEEWFRQRKACEFGFDVTNRREYQPGDDNPLRWDLRYELTCSDAPLEE